VTQLNGLLPGMAQQREEEGRFARLQFFALLALVTVLVVGLGAYFILQRQADAGADLAGVEARFHQQIEKDLRHEAANIEQYIEFMRARTEGMLKDAIRSEVDKAHDLAMSIYQRRHGVMSEEEVKKEIVETLRPLRFFDGRGYFFIDGMNGMCVLLPINPKLEGSSLIDNQDDAGLYIMRSLIAAASSPEGRGFARYRWFRPGKSGEMADKVAYARRFEPFDWLIGSGDYLEEMERLVQNEVLARLRAQRFIGNGTVGVLHKDGRVLVSPSTPQSEGRRINELASDTESRLVERLLSFGVAGGGFINYDWINPLTGKMSPKRSIVTHPNAWGWVVIAGLPLDGLEEELTQRRAAVTADTTRWVATTVTVLCLALMIAVFLAFASASWLRQTVGSYRRSILDSHSQLREHGRQLYLANFLVDHVSEIVALADADLQLIYINRFGCAALGAADETMLLGRRPALLEPMRGRDEASMQYEAQQTAADGRKMTLEVTANRIQYEGKTYVCAVARDVTAKRQAEWEIRLAATAFDNASEGMVISDHANRIVAVNEAFTRITGYTRADVIGKDPAILSSGRQGAEFYTEMWEALHAGGHWSGEIWNRRKDGYVYPEWLSLRLVRDEEGRVVNHIAAFTDITEIRRQEERIRHLAQYDFLTDLPNRFLLQDRLERAIAGSRRNARKVGLLFVDLDRFKNINDSLGHGVGDKLLRLVGARLAAAVRACDTVSRQGGDEFVILVTDMEQAEAAAVVARKVIAALDGPFDVDGHELTISPSVGIAVYPDDGEGQDDLLRNADMAMYSAKEAGRRTYRFFTPELDVRASERLWVETNLRRAITGGELELHFQPQFAAGGKERLIGFEALVRWRHPDGRLISPAQFIPIAEDTGLIIPLGDWVLENAVGALAKLPAGTEKLTMAVNLSPMQLRRPGWVQKVMETLQAQNIDPRRLELEVTEGVLMEGSETMTKPLADLREAGVSIAIDDFGTGYSSLTYLRRFHVDRLKIDKGFVNELDDGGDGEAMVGAIIAMARSLHMETVAEGVETRFQADRLAELGCDVLQGFLLGRPLPFDDFIKLATASVE
jgi:diguanylate cyclase (GGDEF)-like protein/PAS domain S-box-containing protein